ncbi:MAG: amino acid adenylation domain-containing protein [Anaerolineales bacterium]|nr:amino acid adenylation domain-containing protein [Anaerolineales bacterium]
MLLHQLLDHSALVYPQRLAVEDDQGGRLTYRELADLSNQLRDRLRHAGVRPGDRVGLYLRKSINAVAALFGVLKAGAAYVPVDFSAPLARNAYILQDCSVKAVVLAAEYAERVSAALGSRDPSPILLPLAETGSGVPLRLALDHLQARDPAPAAAVEQVSPDALAYILYTSGSTGQPKGVMLSHRNAVSYVDWVTEVLHPTNQDRFSSHAPLHFDLSILDLFVPIQHGAAVFLIGSELGKDPLSLAAFISAQRITRWYSTPTILSLLAQYGKLSQHDFAALQTVLFAGEVFPLKHLRALKALLPGPKFYNLYGPTETNVCTYYEIPQNIPADRVQPYPIGRVCSHFQAAVLDEHGQTIPAGQAGELHVRGTGVMLGYWNLPEQTARAFRLDSAGRRWYQTGDIVVQTADGDYVYVGRRDRMVKKRGYRIELGEIEAGLYRHPAVKEVAVVALIDENGVRIKAYLCFPPTENRPALIDLKRFCAEHLPTYMIPDLFAFPDALPKTSTDKIDYQRLAQSSD